MGTRPQRPPASLLHKAPFCEAPASRYAKASLGAGRRCAPYGFTKQALCKVAEAGAVFLGVCVALFRRCAQFSSQWPAASHHVSAPPTPSGFAACPVCPQGAPNSTSLGQGYRRRWRAAIALLLQPRNWPNRGCLQPLDLAPPRLPRPALIDFPGPFAKLFHATDHDTCSRNALCTNVRHSWQKVLAIWPQQSGLKSHRPGGRWQAPQQQIAAHARHGCGKPAAKLPEAKYEA